MSLNQIQIYLKIEKVYSKSKFSINGVSYKKKFIIKIQNSNFSKSHVNTFQNHQMED
jgi:hypothetical protein